LNDKPAIVVIADDLSGAAELAGIAYSRGLTAEVQRGFDPATDAEVVAVDTDTRHLPPDEASTIVFALAQRILAERSRLVFKKVDSVLRGNVRAEIEALLSAFGRQRAVLIPANPSRGRVIRGGRYYIGNLLLDQTHFARDPEHPRRSAKVTELLGAAGQYAVRQIAEDTPLPRDGIVVPDVSNAEDLLLRAQQIDGATLSAGAAEFFAALVDVQIGSLTAAPRDDRNVARNIIQPPALLVCGSAASWPERLQTCLSAQMPVLTIADWRQDVSARGAVLLGLGDIDAQSSSPDRLAQLAEAAKELIDRQRIKSVLAEGGATAAAVADRCGWQRLEVVAAAPDGVGVVQSLDAMAPVLLIKPGSYPWPEKIWQSFCACSARP
jgi:D-threonate/D-erythronate kinase